MAATVLIVDDHPGFRSFVRALLEAEGFDVVGEAADGASALALARTLAPGLVLLDVALTWTASPSARPSSRTALVQP